MPFQLPQPTPEDHHQEHQDGKLHSSRCFTVESYPNNSAKVNRKRWHSFQLVEKGETLIFIIFPPYTEYGAPDKILYRSGSLQIRRVNQCGNTLTVVSFANIIGKVNRYENVKQCFFKEKNERPKKPRIFTPYGGDKLFADGTVKN